MTPIAVLAGGVDAIAEGARIACDTFGFSGTLDTNEEHDFHGRKVKGWDLPEVIWNVLSAVYRLSTDLRESMDSRIVAPSGMQSREWLDEMLKMLETIVSEVEQLKTDRLNESCRRSEPHYHVDAIRVNRTQKIYRDLRGYRGHLEVLAEMSEERVKAPQIDKTAPKKRKKKARHRATDDIQPLPRIQAETVQIVGEYKGNIAEAARRLGKDRKTVEQSYTAAMGKLGKSATKHRTTSLPNDWRGQSGSPRN